MAHRSPRSGHDYARFAWRILGLAAWKLLELLLAMLVMFAILVLVSLPLIAFVWWLLKYAAGQ